MKKVIFFCGLILLTASCKQATETAESPSSDSLSNSKISPLAQPIDDCNPDTACSDDVIVLVDKTKVDEVWFEANKCYICAKSISDATCSYYVVNLGLISKTDEATIAKWLGTNSDKICYDDSYPFIRKSHIMLTKVITDAATDVIKKGKDTKILLSELVAKIPSFDNTFYDTYLKMDEDSTTNQLVFSPEKNFANGMYCYSVPFLKSIISFHKIDPKNFKNYTLRFTQVKDPTPGSNATLIVFRFEGGGLLEFYDYSTNPGTPVPPTTPRHPHFTNKFY